MVSVLNRFKDIVTANMTAIFNNDKNSMNEVTKYIRELERDLGKVKAEAEAVIEEEKRLKREIDECTSDIEKLQAYAEKSVLLGNDDDAVGFLASKNKAVNHLASLESNYEIVQMNATKMKLMKSKIEKDLLELNEKRDELMRKNQLAQNQEKLNEKLANANELSDEISSIGGVKDDLQKQLDQIDAMEELNKPQKSEIDDLMSKYDNM